ncbi:hypothetical protein FH972_023940 [Carpinus fangiana]|uniref:Uncharacterized protein n=1 Tax=Carpinus fangiana TaxID=176857 RepID=A0A5N6KWW8_9ROSI|nr:hypothetical protein FH972_023940 [Carpinus fangiana]
MVIGCAAPSGGLKPCNLDNTRKTSIANSKTLRYSLKLEPEKIQVTGASQSCEFGTAVVFVVVTCGGLVCCVSQLFVGRQPTQATCLHTSTHPGHSGQTPIEGVMRGCSLRILPRKGCAHILKASSPPFEAECRSSEVHDSADCLVVGNQIEHVWSCPP